MACPLFLIKLLIRSGVARLLPGVRRATSGAGAFLHYYSDRVLAAPQRALREAVAFLEPPAPDAIDLTLGAPRFDLVPSGSSKLPADRRGWPPAWGLTELRQAVAAKLAAEHQLPTNPAEEVLITAGAAGAITVALDTFVNAGDRVVLFDPTCPLYAFALQQRRARVRWLPTWLDNGRTRFRLDHLARSLRGARLLVLNSPANPTGGVLAADDLEQLAWWAQRRDVLILSDEVFAAYHYEARPASIGTQARARRRTLTVGGASKEYALAWARVGWLAGHRHLVRPCALTAGLQTPFVPTLCQQIALAALRQGPDAFAPIRAEFEARRRYAFERLRALGLKPAWPAGAFFFWVPVHEFGLTGQAFAQQLLAAKKVRLTPGGAFGPSGAGYVRLSYAAEDGRLREGLGRLAEFLRERQMRPAHGSKQAA